MTYQEARAYIKKISGRGSVYGLEGIKGLMAELGDVQERLSVVHIAGTNGKGSVGAFLAAVLNEAGYHVGRYTSPAVFSPLEVWQADGVCMTSEEYTKIMSQVKIACDILVSKGGRQPTVFEVETAMAFLWFFRKKCDYVLLETGMGGETDATNLIRKPVCSVITSIGMDHMQFLGGTIEEIAAAKAGIIKQGRPVVTAGQKPEVFRILQKKAKEKEAVFFAADPSQWKVLSENAREIQCRYQESDEESGVRIRLRMTGSYQIENALLALTVARKIFGIPLDTVAAGLYRAVWPGRFERIKDSPLFIIDGAHNADAAEKLRETIQKDFTNRRITYIIGVLADKEYRKMLEILLPFASRVYTVTPDSPRALAGERLKEQASACCRRMEIRACETVEQAVALALAHAAEDEVILAFGSLSYLGRVKRAVSAK